MIKVCAHYCGTTILLEEFETLEEAEEFMTHNYILHYEDEMENADDDELIYADEMFIDNDTEEDDELPFTEPLGFWADPNDDLPF